MGHGLDTYVGGSVVQWVCGFGILRGHRNRIQGLWLRQVDSRQHQIGESSSIGKGDC